MIILLKNIEIAASVIIALLLMTLCIYQFYKGSYEFAVIALIMMVINIFYLKKEVKEKKEDNY